MRGAAILLLTICGATSVNPDAVTKIDAHRARVIGEAISRQVPELIWLHDSFGVGNREFVVRGLLEPGTIAVLYGEPGSGKSTIAVNLAFAIATGSTWRGRETSQGFVLHIAGEGARGLRLRQAAHCKHFDVPRTAPYAVLPQAVAFNHGADQDLVAVIGEAARDIGYPPQLVIVDTLARCLVGDENSGADMANFIRACDHVRTTTGASILILHHSGKDTTKGARGHSSLRAAADTELQVEGVSNPRTLFVKKQRDLELAEPMAFRLEPITITDDPTNPVTSCVVIHEDAPPPAKAKPSGRNQVAAVTALREWSRSHPGADRIDTETIHELLKTQDIARKRRPEVLNFMVNAKVITPSVGGYVIDGSLL